MLQFTDKKFKQDNDPTVGVEFGSKTLELRSKVVKLQIWDTVMNAFLKKLFFWKKKNLIEIFSLLIEIFFLNFFF